jgi:hypothetical protein
MSTKELKDFFESKGIKNHLSFDSVHQETWLLCAYDLYNRLVEKELGEQVSLERSSKFADLMTKKVATNEESVLLLGDSKLINENLKLVPEITIGKDRIIKNVRIIAAGWSKNKKYYSKEALATLLPFMAEARLMFVNHRYEELGRDLRDAMSKIVEIWQAPNGDLMANIELLDNPQFEYLVEAIKKDPTIIGLSIFAYAITEAGTAEGKDGTIVKYFIGAHSTDWVYNPGAKGGFDVAENMYDFFSESAMTLMESAHDIIDENFKEVVASRSLWQIGEWFTDYVVWYILYNSQYTVEEKKQLVEQGLKEFGELFTKYIEEAGYYESEETSEEGCSDTKKKKMKKHKDMENEIIKKFPQLKESFDKFTQIMTELQTDITTNKETNMAILTLETLKETSPQVHSALVSEATIEATKLFENATKVFEDKIKSLETQVQKMEGLQTELTAKTTEFTNLTATLKETQDKLVKFEESEKLAVEKANATARLKFIEDTIGHKDMPEGFTKENIPATIMKHLEDVKSCTEIAVTEIVRDLAGIRVNQNADSKLTSPKKETVETQTTESTSVDAVESDLFKNQQ